MNNEIQKIIDAGLVFVSALQKMVGDVIKTFTITNIDGQYFNINLGAECQNTLAIVKELPPTIRFGIGGYFHMNKNVINLLMWFWKYFGYEYMALNTKSIRTPQLDYMVWFTVSKVKISNSAEYVLEYYAHGMENTELFNEFPFRKKITSVNVTEDTSIKSPSKKTIHLYIGEKEYFTHWVYWRDEEYFKCLVEQSLLDGVEMVLQDVYDR